MKNAYPFKGKVINLSKRPEKKGKVVVCDELLIIEDEGIMGDHGGIKYKHRQVTIIQKEHLIAAGSLLHRSPLEFELTRRNILIEGINLSNMKDKFIKIGTVVLEITGACNPCKNMEAEFGEGAFNAMMGHGGMLASVVKGGAIQIGNQVTFLGDSHSNV